MVLRSPLSVRSFRVVFPVLVIVGVYAVSFLLPAVTASTRYENENGTARVARHSVSGVQAFQTTLGVTRTLPVTLHSLYWLPNPLLWLGCGFLLLRRRKMAAAAGGIALLLGLLPLFSLREENYIWMAGYWIWLASMVLLTLSDARWRWSRTIHPG